MLEYLNPPHNYTSNDLIVQMSYHHIAMIYTYDELFHSYMKDVSFKWSYRKTPTVLLTAKHSTKGKNAATECNGIASWIEVIYARGLH